MDNHRYTTDIKKVYLSKVTCKNDNCYQFVTESFKEEYPNLEVLEFFECDVSLVEDENV